MSKPHLAIQNQAVKYAQKDMNGDDINIKELEGKIPDKTTSLYFVEAIVYYADTDDDETFYWTKGGSIEFGVVAQSGITNVEELFTMSHRFIIDTGCNCISPYSGFKGDLYPIHIKMSKRNNVYTISVTGYHFDSEQIEVIEFKNTTQLAKGANKIDSPYISSEIKLFNK